MAIIRGRQMGLDMPTLAKQFKTSKSVIWTTLNTPNLSKATRRPLKTSSGDDRIIVRMSKKNPRLTSTDINSELKDKYGVQLTWLPGVQGHWKKTFAPRFTLQKAPREQANDSGEEPFSSTEVGKVSSALGWNKVLWSDESKYLIIGTDGVTLVQRPGDQRNDPKHQVPTVKHGGGNVMMWGCFHANGVGSLIRITGTMESYMYKNILEKEMLPFGRSQMGRLVRTASSERYDLAKPISRPEFLRASLGGSCNSRNNGQDPTSDPDELDRVHAKRCEAVMKAKGMATKY
uniref:Uncharacterized protein n=1 Tax=Caenorhabditis japonica TaxID=281687 RepID=A0A8R1IDS4_CAEJA